MKLWECRYTLTSPYSVMKVVDYWYSVPGPSLEKIQEHWNRVHPGYYTISEFGAEKIEPQEGQAQRLRVLESVAKDLEA